MTIFDLLLTAIACLLGVAIIVMWRRDRAEQLRWRANLLSCATCGLEHCERSFGLDGLPRLEGRADGRKVEVRLIRDDVSYRKLPSLWLCVSVRARLSAPTLDIVARERNTEFYAVALNLENFIQKPPEWPGDLTLHCSESAPPLRAIAEHVCSYFADPKAKELLVTPSGIRLVYQLAQARRAEYLVLRSGHFEIDVVPENLLRRMLAQATALITTISLTLPDSTAGSSQ